MCAMKVVGEVAYGLYESPQKNPIRWRILKKTGDNIATAQTTFFKCKDYFNDVVAAYRGKFFSVYGFNNKTLDLTDDQLFVQVAFLHDKANYCATIDAVINPKLKAEGFLELVYDDVDGEANSLILVFDKKLFDNTYTISFLTYLLRIANAPQSFDSYEKLTTSENAKTDRPFASHYDKIISSSFCSPLKQPFWWWAGGEYNSEKPNEVCGSTIHNNGCYSWMNSIVNGF